MARFLFPRGRALVEEASAFKTCFQPGPRPARDAINHGEYQELTLCRLLAVRFFVIPDAKSFTSKPNSNIKVVFLGDAENKVRTS